MSKLLRKSLFAKMLAVALTAALTFSGTAFAAPVGSGHENKTTADEKETDVFPYDSEVTSFDSELETSGDAFSGMLTPEKESEIEAEEESKAEEKSEAEDDLEAEEDSEAEDDSEADKESEEEAEEGSEAEEAVITDSEETLEIADKEAKEPFDAQPLDEMEAESAEEVISAKIEEMPEGAAEGSPQPSEEANPAGSQELLDEAAPAGSRQPSDEASILYGEKEQQHDAKQTEESRQQTKEDSYFLEDDVRKEIVTEASMGVLAAGLCSEYSDLSWSLDETGTLTISGNGDMPDYWYSSDSSDAPWQAYKEKITSLVIESGVTGIGRLAFYFCGSLKSVTIPNSVTEIGQSAFGGCSGLQSVTIPNSVTSIGSAAFSGCSSLQNVTIPYGVTSIEFHSFSECSSLKSISIPDSVTQIKTWAFYKCSNLQSVTIPKDVTVIDDYAFYDCSSLKSVKIPGKVMYISSYAFRGCSNLTNVKISNGVTSIKEGAFCECFGISSVTIPESVTSIGKYAFLKCTSLTEINIPDGVTTIVSKAFAGCSGLSSIIIPDSVTSIGAEAFNRCSKLTIYGNKGSCAEEYANNNDIPFETMEEAAKKSIKECEITGIAAKTYTGNPQTQSLTVKVGSVTLKKGTDYALSYENNINAGTATVIITGKGNYKYSVSRKFKINPAAQSITAKASATSVSVGKTTIVSITGAKGTKTYVSSDTSIATVNSKGKVVAKKVGIVKITAKASATTNYKSSSRIVTIKVVPAAAASLKAINQATGIKLNWKKVAGANGYIIYRNNRKIKTIGKGATVTYTDTAANSNGTKYAYKIFAKASTGTSTLSKSIVTYRVAQPAIKTLKNSVAKKATATWEKNAGATGYEVQYGLKKNFSDANIVTIKKAATVKITFSKLTKDRTYYVRMRAYKTVGKSKYYSAWSAAKTVKITK